MKYRIFSFVLCAMIIFGMATPAAATADDKDAAIKYISENKIYQGDTAGSLNLESGLTRAELSVILTRIRGDEDMVKASEKEYRSYCYFTDVPEWAKAFVGYCYDSSLMQGYNAFDFGPSDFVTPAQACTVMLRVLGYPETDWNYATACEKAVASGLSPASGLSGKTIKRGDMAVIIYRAMTGSHAGQSFVGDGSGRISDIPLTYKRVDGKDLSREDFSPKANPAVFTGIYTRGMYNAAYQSYIDREVIASQNNEKNFNPYYAYASAVNPNFDGSNKFDAPLSDISRMYNFHTNGEPYAKEVYKYPGYLIVTVRNNDYKLDETTLDILEKAKSLTDKEKIRLFNDFVRSRITYDAKSAAPIPMVFTAKEPVKGACGSYAHAFMYLCEKSGIPCIGVSGDNHAWTMVYLDGKWLHCDPTNNNLFAETVRFNFYDEMRVAFAKEIVVPGGTK